MAEGLVQKFRVSNYSVSLCEKCDHNRSWHIAQAGKPTPSSLARWPAAVRRCACCMKEVERK